MLPRCKCKYYRLRVQYFYAAERRRRFSFLQHENLLRAEVAIPVTNNRNLPQRGNMLLENVASVMSKIESNAVRRFDVSNIIIKNEEKVDVALLLIFLIKCCNKQLTIRSVMSAGTKMKSFVSGRANWGKIPKVGRI